MISFLITTFIFCFTFSSSAKSFNPHYIISQLDYSAPITKHPTPHHQLVATYQRTIKRGDTLGRILKKAGVGRNKNDLKVQIEQIMEADINILVLDVIEAGQVIKLWIDQNKQLQKLEITLNAARKVIYNRSKNNQFEYKDIHRKGIWRTKTINGKVKKSFYVSARKANLTPSEIIFIQSLLDTQLNFSKDVNRNEVFSVLRKEQYIDGYPTGNRQLVGVIYKSRHGQQYTAFLNKDGDYYTAQGRSLSKPFLRLPIEAKYRLSSRFNPYRKHPITKRSRPHNGVDLATPAGTPIVAPGDGMIKLISKHKYAGVYIVIEHNGAYSTRYLHLSKPLVTEGQRVTRGETIALSGNTGRTTGPHLHYELHKNGRAINPLKAKVNASTFLPEEHMDQFTNLVNYYNSFF